MRLRFRNLKKSELIRQSIEERLSDDFIRFPGLLPQMVHVTVSMENSPRQAGPDLFRIKLRVTEGQFKGVVLEKEAQSFYSALGELNSRLVERLSRFEGKRRALKRKGSRRQFAA